MEKKITIIGIVIAVMLFPISFIAVEQIYVQMQIAIALQDAENKQASLEAQEAANNKRLRTELHADCIEQGNSDINDCIERHKRSWGITD